MPDIAEIKALLNPIAKEYGVKRLYLFGSFAKGTATSQSDVDLLVENLVTTAGIGEGFRNQISGTEILLYEAL